MRGDATINVQCDVEGCYNDIDIPLTALAQRGSWDEREVERLLKRYGWRTDGDKDNCGEHDED